MEYALGGLVVLVVLAFVVFPLVYRKREGSSTSPASRSASELAAERAEIYREQLELELDLKVGKLDEADFRELSDALLARAAALISQEEAQGAAVEAEIEHEIAAMRAAMRTTAAAPARRPEESRA